MNTVFYVYAIYSEVKNKIYIGFTSRSPQERLYAHNFIEKNSFTSKYRPWTIVYTKEFDSKEEALKKERKLKRFQRRKFISINNSTYYH